jgi:hypothetical protein
VNKQLHKQINGLANKLHFIFASRNGQHCAVELLLVEASPPAYVQGIVCSLKESFGFIERADKVNEVCYITTALMQFKLHSVKSQGHSN